MIHPVVLLYFELILNSMAWGIEVICEIRKADICGGGILSLLSLKGLNWNKRSLNFETFEIWKSKKQKLTETFLTIWNTCISSISDLICPWSHQLKRGSDGDDDDEDDGDDVDEHDSEYDEDENTDEMPKNKWVSFDGGCQFFSSSFSSYIWCLT